ncbi:hypothetical protein [Mandarin fish ranavirus]|nr:hypothetical protein [Mandarin fish ranavirus]
MLAACMTTSAPIMALVTAAASLTLPLTSLSLGLQNSMAGITVTSYATISVTSGACLNRHLTMCRPKKPQPPVIKYFTIFPQTNV